MGELRIETIAVGSELLETSRVDTNSAWMVDRLADLGLAIQRKTVVGDDPSELRNLFSEVIQRSDVIICTGGLGPTFDDLTKEVWSEVLGDVLEEDAQIVCDIREMFRIRQRPFTENNLKQALVPSKAKALRNPVGTAPGIYWDLVREKHFPVRSVLRNPARKAGARQNPCSTPFGDRMLSRCSIFARSRPYEHVQSRRQIFLLPGVPREMQELWRLYVEPVLREQAGQSIHTLRLLVGGVGESALDARLAPLRHKHGSLCWTILCHQGQVEMQARSACREALDAAERDFVQELGPDLVCVGEDSLESAVLQQLRSRAETLAVAESMTGGRIASLLTAVSGASEVFMGGPIVYSAKAKGLYCDISEDFIDKHGTVSEATTRLLAENTKRQMGTTWALAITGNAGPAVDAGSQAKVGEVHIAVAGPQGTCSLESVFPGERSLVLTRSAFQALDFLRRNIV